MRKRAKHIEQDEIAGRESVADAVLGAALEALADVAVVVDRSGRVLVASPLATPRLGADPVGHPFLDLLAQPTRDEVAFHFRRWADTGAVGAFATTRRVAFRRADGTTFPAEMVARPGGAHLVVCVRTAPVSDDTAGDGLEARFRDLAASAPVLLWTSGPADAGYTWFSDAWLRFTGRPLEAELGTGWMDGIHPEDYERCVEVDAKAFAEREPFEMEYRLRDADGTYRWVLDRGSPRFGEAGEFAGFVGACVDIHDARAIQVELGLRERQQAAVAALGRHVLETTDIDALFGAAVTTTARTLDVEYVALLERMGNELVFRTGTGWRAEPAGRVVATTGDRTLASATITRQEPVVVSDWNEERHLLQSSLLKEHGARSSMSAVVRGIDEPFGILTVHTRRPRAFGDDDVLFLRNVANVLAASAIRHDEARALRAREAEARLALSAGHMGSWRWNPSSGRVSWSPEMEALYGLAPGSFPGTFDAFVAGVHPDDRELVTTTITRAVETGSEIAMEHRALAPDGTVRWLDARGHAVSAEPGSPWIGVGIDVTARKEAEAIQARLFEGEQAARREAEVVARALDESQAVLEALLANAPIGFCFLDRDLRYQRLNSALAEINGLPVAAHLGRTVRDMVPSLADQLEPIFQSVLTTGEPVVDVEIAGETARDPGVERVWNVGYYRVDDAHGEVVGIGVVVVETTEQAQAAAERERLLRKAQEAQARERRTNRELVETIARLDTLLANAPVGFAFCDTDLRFVRVNEQLASINGLPVDAHLGRTVPEIAPELWDAIGPALSQVLDTGESAVDLEVSGQTPAAPGVERHWLTGFYPVTGSDGATLGVGALIMEITERKRGELAARLVGAAGELFGADLPLVELLDEAVRLPLPDFADACSLYLPEPDHRRPTVAIAHSDHAREAILRAATTVDLDPTGGTPTALALRSGGTHRIERVGAPDAAVVTPREHLDAAIAIDVTSVIAVPLRVGERLLGAMTFIQAGSGRCFQAADEALAEEVARRIAGAIENARLARDARRAQSRLDLLARASELLAVELDSEARVQAIASLPLPDLGDVGSVYVLEPDGVLRLAAAAHADPEKQAVLDSVIEWPVFAPESDAAPAAAIRGGRSLIVDPVPEGLLSEFAGGDESRRRVAEAIRVTSLLWVPLPGRNGPLGALAYGYTDSGRRYTQHDLPIAEELARRVAPSFEQALRYEQEQATAEVLQRSLLPERLPRVHDLRLAARYLPGSAGAKVGGDWYDAMDRSEGGTLLAIGDIVGHGVRAAAGMGKLRTAFQLCALEGLEPAAILDRLNRYFCALPDSDMATLCLLLVDSVRNRLLYASAGHPPPLIGRPDGGLGFLSGARGLPLCVAAGEQYEQVEIALAPGSVLALYTDGLVERRGESLDEGFLRLATAVDGGPEDLDALADHVVAELLGDQALLDDAALLVARVAPVGGSLELWLPARPRELASLRRTVGEWLERLGASPVEVYEVTVAVNEIAANAIEHAYGLTDAEFTVTGATEDDAVVMTVRDFGRWRAPRQADRGRGLRLVHELMDDVDVASDAEGTRVRMRRRLGEDSSR